VPFRAQSDLLYKKIKYISQKLKILM